MNDQNILRGAIVGFGFISSKGHLPAYTDRMRKSNDVKIVAICDICPERERDVPAGVKFYTDYEQLIISERDNLDFVDVSTHAADHFKISKMALMNGLHVLCEKPLTTTVKDAEELIKIALKFKRVLFPCHNYKFAPVVSAVREIVNSGRIGKVNAITLNTFRNTHAIGTKEWNPNWRRMKDYSGGGIAMDHGSHSLYLTFEWLGGYPKSVTANSQNLSHPKYNTEDNFSAVYEFENGNANVHLSWTAGVRKVLYILQGELGAITVDDDQVQVATINSCDSDLSSHKAMWQTDYFSVASEWMDSSHVSWFNSTFNRFKLAIAKQDYLSKDIIDAYFCIQSIAKAYESIENNSTKLPLGNNFLQSY